VTQKKLVVASLCCILVASAAFAGELVFKDPTGDDNGPGTYTYPTDQVYIPGSFDLTELKVTWDAKNITFAVSVRAALHDPWRMGTGFAVQMPFVFVKTGPGGFTDGLPGMNLKFAEDDAWNYCVIMSPQPPARVRQEVRTKAANLEKGIIVPNRVRGSGHTITATVPLADFGGGDPTGWGYQVAMQSNEGFPEKNSLLMRQVNEYEGPHRFGGGSDYQCDPQVMDILAGNGEGAEGEVKEQDEELAYKCGPEGQEEKEATLKMVWRHKQ
jgi:carbohydrate-binding DOMON domain-containing protein